MLRCTLLLALLVSLPISAQVTVTPNVPLYNFQVLAGSTRQINVQISGGTKNTVNWSVTSTTGGASATFTDISHSAVASIAGALPTIQVNIGSTAGSCAINGTASYTVTSTATVQVQAQSTDDASKIATFLFNVCSNATPILANGTKSVVVVPAYQQAYQAQRVSLQSWVTGCVDEQGTWSILSQPTGGNGTLADVIFRDTLFSATVPGEYTLQYKANCHGGTNTALVYVTPQPLPSYASTPNQTQPTPCVVDPQAFTNDYEVGAGKQYATLSATPLQLASGAGTIIRIWNTDTTGSSATIYREYLAIHNSGGTATAPYYICGVPDSKGNLPILDGENSVTQTGSPTTLIGCGVVSMIGPSHYGYWQNGSAGPFYTTIASLHIRNGTPANTFTAPSGNTGSGCGPGGSGTTYNWAVGAAGVYVGSGSYINILGDDLDTNTNGLFTAENGNNAWATTTENVAIRGNHIHVSGWATDYTEHQAYMQSFYLLFEGNLVDHYLTTAQGSNLKWRGVEWICRYNFLANGPLRTLDLVENQDQQQYVSIESYLGAPVTLKVGATQPLFDRQPYYDGPRDFHLKASGGGIYGVGDTAGANVIAWYQESAQKDFAYGIVAPSGPAAQNQFHYADDHGVYSGGMADRNGTFYLWNSTVSAAEVVIDVGENANADNTFYQPRAYFANNILWAYQGGISSGKIAVQSVENVILNGVTNLYEAGSVNIATPIVGGSYNVGTVNGWQAGCDPSPCAWPLTSPLNTHIYNLNSANYLFTSTLPFDASTFVPPAGSAAIGAGSVVTGLAAQLPVRWNFNVTTSSLAARMEPLTIGAEDSGVSPPPGPNPPTGLTATVH